MTSAVRKIPNIPIHEEICMCDLCIHESNKQCLKEDCNCCALQHYFDVLKFMKSD